MATRREIVRTQDVRRTYVMGNEQVHALRGISIGSKKDYKHNVTQTWGVMRGNGKIK